MMRKYDVPVGLDYIEHCGRFVRDDSVSVATEYFDDIRSDIVHTNKLSEMHSGWRRKAKFTTTEETATNFVSDAVNLYESDEIELVDLTHLIRPVRYMAAQEYKSEHKQEILKSDISLRSSISSIMTEPIRETPDEMDAEWFIDRLVEGALEAMIEYQDAQRRDVTSYVAEEIFENDVPDDTDAFFFGGSPGVFYNKYRNLIPRVVGGFHDGYFYPRLPYSDDFVNSEFEPVFHDIAEKLR